MLSEIIQKCETVAKYAAVDHYLLPLLPWKSNKFYIFWVCVCSLSYTAGNAHAPYCHLWPVFLYHIFPHYLVNSMIIGKKVFENKTCFDCTTCFGNTSHSEENSRDLWSLSQMYFGLHVKYTLLLSDFNETWILLPDFQKILKKHQISWNFAHWEPSYSVRTDRHD